MTDNYLIYLSQLLKLSIILIIIKDIDNTFIIKKPAKTIFFTGIAAEISRLSKRISFIRDT